MSYVEPIDLFVWRSERGHETGFFILHKDKIVICVDDDYYSGFFTKEQMIELRDTLNSLELDK